MIRTRWRPVQEGPTLRKSAFGGRRTLFLLFLLAVGCGQALGNGHALGGEDEHAQFIIYAHRLGQQALLEQDLDLPGC
jgi:hypothetical protein